MSSQSFLSVLFICVCCASASAVARDVRHAPSTGNFVIYSEPITLNPSEVHNKARPPVALPEKITRLFKDNAMHITSYELDIVGFDSDGNEYSVPLYDTYNHHYIVYMGGNQSMKALYSELKGKDPLGRGVTCWHSDPARDEEKPCRLDSMKNGARCCENGVVLEETPSTDPPATVYAKFSFNYTYATPKSRNIFFLGCCDVTANTTQGFANIEYTVPQCAHGTPVQKCVHVATNVQSVAPNIASQKPDAEIDLVYAAGHVHTGAIRLELIDEKTNQLLCEADLKYGSSEKAGDEKGYLVGIFPCVWPNAIPPRMRADHLLRTVAYYNSSVQRNGVMSLWLMSGAIVEPDLLV